MLASTVAANTPTHRAVAAAALRIERPIVTRILRKSRWGAGGGFAEGTAVGAEDVVVPRPSECCELAGGAAGGGDAHRDVERLAGAGRVRRVAHVDAGHGEGGAGAVSRDDLRKAGLVGEGHAGGGAASGGGVGGLDRLGG